MPNSIRRTFLCNLLIHNPDCLFEKVPAEKTALEVLKLGGGLPENLIESLAKMVSRNMKIREDTKEKFFNVLGITTSNQEVSQFLLRV